MDHGINFKSLAFPIPVVQRFPFASFASQQQQQQQQYQQQQHQKRHQLQKLTNTSTTTTTAPFTRKPAKPCLDFNKVDALVDTNCSFSLSSYYSTDPLSPVDSLKMSARSSEKHRTNHTG